MITYESAKEYFKYKKFIDVSDINFRYIIDNSFPFVRNKKISSILDIEEDMEYYKDHMKYLKKFVDLYWDKTIITPLPIKEFFKLVNSDYGDNYVKLISLSVIELEFFSFNEVIDYVNIHINNNHFILYTYVYVGTHKLRFKFLDKKEYPVISFLNDID